MIKQFAGAGVDKGAASPACLEPVDDGCGHNRHEENCGKGIAQPDAQADERAVERHHARDRRERAEVGCEQEPVGGQVAGHHRHHRVHHDREPALVAEHAPGITEDDEGEDGHHGMEDVEAPFACLIQRTADDQLRRRPEHPGDQVVQEAQLGRQRQRGAQRLDVVAQHRAHHVPVAGVSAQGQILQPAEPVRHQQGEAESRQGQEPQQEKTPEAELVLSVGRVEAEEDKDGREGGEDHALDDTHAVEQGEEQAQRQVEPLREGEEQMRQQQEQQQVESLEMQARRDHPEGHTEGQRDRGHRRGHDRSNDVVAGPFAMVVVETLVHQPGHQQVEQSDAGDATEGAEGIEAVSHRVGR